LRAKSYDPRPRRTNSKGYRQAILNAPEISDVHKHHRGENIPHDTFFKNTLADTFKIPDADFRDFKQIFLESLEKAKLLDKYGDNVRVLDSATEVEPADARSERLKKLGAAVAVKAGDSCFVMQPFATLHGDLREDFQTGHRQNGLAVGAG
jgi:hypothetical protein